jgi:hypothetical protein
MVQGRNTLGYLRTQTFYIPERKYAYKYASITKCLSNFVDVSDNTIVVMGELKDNHGVDTVL